jgi:hypothetical protein
LDWRCEVGAAHGGRQGAPSGRWCGARSALAIGEVIGRLAAAAAATAARPIATDALRRHSGALRRAAAAMLAPCRCSRSQTHSGVGRGEGLHAHAASPEKPRLFRCALMGSSS